MKSLSKYPSESINPKHSRRRDRGRPYTRIEQVPRHLRGLSTNRFGGNSLSRLRGYRPTSKHGPGRTVGGKYRQRIIDDLVKRGLCDK